MLDSLSKMTNGEIITFFRRGARSSRKIFTFYNFFLDMILPLCHFDVMAKHIIKATKDGRNIRISIPAKIIKEMGWSNVKYFLLDNRLADEIIIRRFLDVETRETE